MKPLPLFRLGLLFFTLITASTYTRLAAEEFTLRGIVRDTSDNILPGVSIEVSGSEVATRSDEDGAFSLAIDSSESIRLDLSKDGYLAKQMLISQLGKPIEATLVAKTDDTGLIRLIKPISMSHSLGEIRRDRAKYENRAMDEKLYQEIVERYGEKPAEEAAFRIYLPPRVPTINGLFLISEHGVGGPMIEHPLVREFADRHHLALIGVLGNAIQRGIFPASVLDEILVDIAQQVNHPEIASVPAFTFGHSNGTGFSASYAAMRPARVISWVSFHSGGSWHLVFPGVEKVPGLVMHGNQDSYFDQGQTQAVESLRRERQAPIALLVDGESGHWPRNREHTFSLVLAFCESCLRIRLAATDEIDSDENDNVEIDSNKTWNRSELQPAAIQSGWLGGAYDRAAGGMQMLEIACYADFPGDRDSANWLPDESFAKAWQTYGATGAPFTAPASATLAE